MNEDELRQEIRKLEALCNSIECPDCGGVHHVRINHVGIFPEFVGGLLITACDGYKRLVNQKINILKSRYGINDLP